MTKDYSDSEGDESEDQTDDESVQVEGPQEDAGQVVALWGKKDKYK